MRIKFIGVSGHLESGAPGHFETFHKGLFDAFRMKLGEGNSLFLGLKDRSKPRSWFQPALPRSLTSTIPWIPNRTIRLIGKSNSSVGHAAILYIYEGSLRNLLLFGNIARRYEHIYLYFNLFGAFKYEKLLKSPIQLSIYRALFNFASRRLGSRLILTADTKRFAGVIGNKLRKNFQEFPMYSVIKSDKTNLSTKDSILINFRGNSSEELFKRALEEFVELQNIGIDLHGINQSHLRTYLSNFQNIQILPDQIPEYVYKQSFKRYKRVAFLYDPKFFSMQSSGRLADAVVSGCQIVVPRDTALEQALIEFGNGSSFNFDSPSSLVSALTIEPQLRKSSSVLPTSGRTVELILQSVKSRIESGEGERIGCFAKALNLVVDEIVRALLGVLRVAFGVGKTFKRS